MDSADSLQNFATGCKIGPRRNRCTPFGLIEATHHKGALMGNRGDLHAPDGSLGRQWRSKRWISCVLDGGGWKAPMDAPGHNFPLFFHDETVALSAGHRPCGQCRPEALAAFITAWKLGHGYNATDWVALRDIDKQLHNARLSEMRQRRRVDISSLPEGVFVWCPSIEVRPLRVSGRWLQPWQFGGFGTAVRSDKISGMAYQLTSTPVIAALLAGYKPLK